MPRYEFSEGTSNKFWEITLSKNSFTTTYGKIGTAGQSTTKTFGNEAEAQKEADKLTAEKVKKGYRLAGAGASAARYVELADSRGEAFKELDELVAEKTKKGYVEIGASSSSDGDESSRDLRNPDFEKAIERDPDDRETF